MTPAHSFTVSTAAGQNTPPCITCHTTPDTVTEHCDEIGWIWATSKPCGHQVYIGRTPILEAWLLLQEALGGD